MGVTRFADNKGNIVITKSSYYINLQIQRLFDSNAAGVNDDELEVFAQLMWHSDVWRAIVNEQARRAGYQIGPDGKPIDPGTTNNPTVDPDPKTDITKVDTTGTGDKLPGFGDSVPDQDTDATKTQTATPNPGQTASQDQPQVETVDPNPPVPGPNATQSQIEIFRLAHLINAEKAADRAGPIAFSTPRMTFLILRFALVQFAEWGTGAYALYMHGHNITDALGAIGPWIGHFIK